MVLQRKGTVCLSTTYCPARKLYACQRCCTTQDPNPMPNLPGSAGMLCGCDRGMSTRGLRRSPPGGMRSFCHSIPLGTSGRIDGKQFHFRSFLGTSSRGSTSQKDLLYFQQAVSL